MSAAGPFAYWPEHPFWSFQLLRLLGLTSVGGAELAEVHAVAQRLSPGDDEAWHAGFAALAERSEERHRRALASGMAATAADVGLRATWYHRAAGFLLAPEDPRSAACLAGWHRCFAASAPLATPGLRAVEIPFAGAALHGHLSVPVHGPAPVAVLFGSADGLAEEMYFYLGRRLAERGFAVLMVDCPGQGASLEHGVVAQADFEVPAGAIVDWLAAVDGIDASRVAFVGQSVGGSWALRAAAFEPRVAACVAWSLVYDLAALHRDLSAAAPDVGAHVGALFRSMLGLGSEEPLEPALQPFSLAGVAGRVRCPTLVVHGEGNPLVPLDHAQRAYDELAAADKELLVYPADGPGASHCQVDAPSVAQEDVGDWLVRRLGGPEGIQNTTRGST